MNLIENVLVQIFLLFGSAEQVNALLGDPRTVALIVGALVSISGAVLGVFMLLRKTALTTDAISHTVLLGIVVVFLVFGAIGVNNDLNSPWLIIGAAAAGVLTVVLTEIIHRSGLVKADAALGLAFPLLFAIAIILISRYADDAHLDQDAVMVGEIGLAWANTDSHCLENCEDVVITPDHPQAETGRQCINCSQETGITPRSPDAVFEEVCSNCGVYTAGEAWSRRLIDAPPVQVFFPKAIGVMGLITLLNVGFVLLFYKEMKIASFDNALAATLGFRPGLLNYLLMILVSVTAVGAFDAVGSVLVVAFFIIPTASAYLLTDRLWLMLVLAPLLGILATFLGYDFARGQFLYVIDMNNILAFLDPIVGLDGYTQWNTSISAGMVVMSFVIFLVIWIFSPKYGLILNVVRHRLQRRNFLAQMLMGHIHTHQGTEREQTELAVETLHEHMKWTPQQVNRVLAQTRSANWVTVENGLALLTPRGKTQVTQFIQQNLVARRASQLSTEVT